MRKKEAWMFKGSFVLAKGKRAKIISIQENRFVNRLAGSDYVQYIDAKLDNETSPIRYHPSEIEQLVAVVK